MSQEVKSGFYRQSLWKYIDGPGVNRSFLHELLRSAGHGKYKQDNPESTESLQVGDAFHAAGLEPERFEKEYIILPDDCKPGTADNPNPGMKARKKAFEAKAIMKGQTIIQPKDYQMVKEMVGVVHAEQKAMDLLCDGEAEKSGYFIDPEYNILVKIRLDYINEVTNIITDLKSCADARFFQFRKAVYDHGYDLQAFMALYGCTQITGYSHSEFRFICVEKEGYHGLKIYRADDEMLNTGYGKYHQAMKLYKECIEKDVWDGYDAECEDMGSPDYAKAGTKAYWD